VTLTAPNVAGKQQEHTQPFYGPFSGTTQVSWCIIWTMLQGKITEADTPTIRMGATRSVLIS